MQIPTGEWSAAGDGQQFGNVRGVVEHWAEYELVSQSNEKVAKALKLPSNWKDFLAMNSG